MSSERRPPRVNRRATASLNELAVKLVPTRGGRKEGDEKAEKVRRMAGQVGERRADTGPREVGTVDLVEVAARTQQSKALARAVRFAIADLGGRVTERVIGPRPGVRVIARGKGRVKVLRLARLRAGLGVAHLAAATIFGLAGGNGDGAGTAPQIAAAREAGSDIRVSPRARTTSIREGTVKDRGGIIRALGVSARLLDFLEGRPVHGGLARRASTARVQAGRVGA